MTEQEQTIGSLVLNGRDPEDGTWFFDETQAQVNGFTVAYELPNREAAEEAGIPSSVLDSYEKERGLENGEYSQGGLFDWFCNNNHLFRSVFKSTEADDEEDEDYKYYDDED